MHPLEEPVEPVPSDPDPEETRANARAIYGVLAHVAAVAGDFDGALWGYWLHPGEPEDVGPLIVKLTTEGELRIVSGESLVEALVFDRCGEADVSQIAAYCERHGIPFTARSSADLRPVKPIMHPAALQEKLFKLPPRSRASWVSG